jgi:hypothetical protein
MYYSFEIYFTLVIPRERYYLLLSKELLLATSIFSIKKLKEDPNPSVD